MRTQGRLSGLLFLLVACSDASPQQAARSTQWPANATPVAKALALGATPLAIERDVPRLLNGTSRMAAAPAATATLSALTHLERLAPAWGVSTLPELVALGEVPVDGGRIVRVEQRVDGMPIDRGEMRVMIGSGGTMIAASGILTAGDAIKTPATFTIDEAAAIDRAVAHTYGGMPINVVTEQARAKRAWYRTDNLLVAAWVVQAYTGYANSTDSVLYRTVLSADGRRVLEHRSLTESVAFQYRVFAETTGDFRPKDGPTLDATPHPTGVVNSGFFPGYTTPALVSVEGLNKNPQGVADPWLASTRTETLGNNVEAYVDFNAPSGLSFGDFRATVTSQRTFDRTYDTSKEPLSTQAQQMASITSLFYAINYLHDFWYDAGFTETAGNAQENNYGRGGEDRDAILAEAQDNALGGSRNNANMNTPDDGLPPRMQVFLWSGTEDFSLAAGTHTYATNTAAFGPKSYDITGTVTLANDNTGTATDACEALGAGATTGKVVLADRGNCSFKRKALNIQNAGGIGMLLANNAAGAAPFLGEDTMITNTINIGSMSLSMADGATVKADLQAGPVTTTMHRLMGVELDGGLDSTLVAHEFGHYLHHRLSLCGSRLCSAMSEGWGDFNALLQTARDGDNLDGAYPFSVYTTQSFSDDPAYFGIRRAPYSVNPDINALSFRHMGDGEPLPTNHPFLVFGNNAEVHNAGEIWAAALWEVYVALQKAGTDFEATRKKMAKYVVSGLLMSPVDGTPTEIRDAILTAIRASSPADFDVAAAAFARRGMGSCAISPARESTNFSGIVEGAEVAGRAIAGAEITEAVTACDEDNVLDPGETLKIRVPIANRGHKALTNVSATLASTTPGLTVVTQPAQLASLDPYATGELVAEVKLDGDLATPIGGEFTLAITASGGCEPTTMKTFSIRLNADDVAESSATDAFDTDASIWTTTNDEVPVWTHVRDSALDGVWHGADIGTTSDTSLVTPPVTVTDQAFTVALDHEYSFEVGTGAAMEAFDGGVIEYTTDGGATWKDVSTLVSPGYTKTLDAGNALGARMAFTGKNPAYPQTDALMLDFGTQLAGKTVQLRFRIGTDAGVGAPGWTIDNVAFTGIAGTPFPAQVADTATCDGTEPPKEDDDGGGCCDAGPLGAANVGAAFGVLALVLRRRRVAAVRRPGRAGGK